MTHSDSNTPPRRRFVAICQNRSCLRSRSDQVLAAFQQHQSDTLMVAGSGCMGQCGSGPMVRVMPDGTWYCRVSPKDVPKIVTEHLENDRPVKRLLHPRFHPQFDASSFPQPPLSDQ
ncbi:NAD(P)H-dependent oxidoreductase subunit E [Pseudanabaena sp. FACHB-2040]|uniref:NAD(P)H-dependent oxidoreductase subunit E n=1 Tax=Pseudanabaena sp. FACHB-2040 TaxID=2692859 RepID=UPI001683929A|nr:(2Fe-2S) ferredoxin domain-containing protein [Pseudanabaena sp. FACHB-2040]